MTLKATLIAGLAAASVIASAGLGLAQEEKKNPVVEARQSLMHLYAFNLGLLGGMAKGEIEYDAEAAGAAASNLAALAATDQTRIWAEGTDNATLGDSTEALPAIWENSDDFAAKRTALVEASATMADAAGGGLDGLRGAMGALGGACGGCHKAYRK